MANNDDQQVQTGEVISTSVALPRLLTTAEVADYLRVPVQTLYTMRHEGRGPQAIPGVTKGLRYRADRLLEWITEQEARNGQKAALEP